MKIAKTPGKYIATITAHEWIPNYPHSGVTEVVDIEFPDGSYCRVRYTMQMKHLGLFVGSMFRFDAWCGFDTKYRIGFGKVHYDDGSYNGLYLYRLHNLSDVAPGSAKTVSTVGNNAA